MESIYLDLDDFDETARRGAMKMKDKRGKHRVRSRYGDEMLQQTTQRKAVRNRQAPRVLFHSYPETDSSNECNIITAHSMKHTTHVLIYLFITTNKLN